MKRVSNKSSVFFKLSSGRFSSSVFGHGFNVSKKNSFSAGLQNRRFNDIHLEMQRQIVKFENIRGLCIIKSLPVFSNTSENTIINKKKYNIENIDVSLKNISDSSESSVSIIKNINHEHDTNVNVNIDVSNFNNGKSLNDNNTALVKNEFNIYNTFRMFPVFPEINKSNYMVLDGLKINCLEKNPQVQATIRSLKGNRVTLTDIYARKLSDIVINTLESLSYGRHSLIIQISSVDIKGQIFYTVRILGSLTSGLISNIMPFWNEVIDYHLINKRAEIKNRDFLYEKDPNEYTYGEYLRNMHIYFNPEYFRLLLLLRGYITKEIVEKNIDEFCSKSILNNTYSINNFRRLSDCPSFHGVEKTVYFDTIKNVIVKKGFKGTLSCLKENRPEFISNPVAITVNLRKSQFCKVFDLYSSVINLSPKALNTVVLDLNLISRSLEQRNKEVNILNKRVNNDPNCMNAITELSKILDSPIIIDIDFTAIDI